MAPLQAAYTKLSSTRPYGHTAPSASGSLAFVRTEQLRADLEVGQEYYLRKITEGKTPAEARRALKRRLSNVVYRIMKGDQRTHLAQAA
ncbi:hypothetical protein [Kitasatospora azatica]|uniref:hypothetical protein n=1 Tax=Kitasatospora azatica TaxID=58347 RepID=UPI00056D5EEE|nr:hypothetical protein [Kitasatospora azatica]